MKNHKKLEKIKVIIKLESLFFSFIEDNFLGYMFYKYDFFYALGLFFKMLFQRKKFQEKLLYALQYENLMDFIWVNDELINIINAMKKEKKYYFILISHHHQSIVKFFYAYLNCNDFIGNNNKNYSIYKLLHKNLSGEQIKKSIFITDSFDINIIKEVNKIITCGSLIKILFNHYWNKTLINVYTPINNYHKNLFDQLNKMKPSCHHSYLLLNFKIITSEIFLILRLFFLKILFFIILMVLLEYIYWPREISSYWAIISIIETNYLINIINIIQVFKPDNADYLKFHEFFKNRVLKSFGSLRIGLLLFSFISFAYLKNIFFLLFHIMIMGIFLKYPGGIFSQYFQYKFFFGLINIFLYLLLAL